MAKTQGTTAIRPIQFSATRKIKGDGTRGVRVISRLENWLYGLRKQVHLSLVVGTDGWDGTGAGPDQEKGTLHVTAGASLETPIETDFWFTPEAALHDATFGAVAEVAVGDTLEVTINLTGSVGTESKTISFTSADNGTEKTTTLDLSNATAGDEWVDVTIDVQRTAGAGTPELRETAFEEAQVTAGLPDPVND